MSPVDIGGSQPIGATAEDVLSDNVHHVVAYFAPTIISQIYTLSSQLYVEGRAAGSKAIDGLWNFNDVPLPWARLPIVVLYENTGATTPGDDHTIRFDWESDPWLSGGSPGTSVDITAVGNTSQWGVATGNIVVTATGDDTLRMWLVNTGGSGVVRVHAVHVRPQALTVINAGAVTVGGLTFYPLDTTEIDQDSPLTVAHRQAQWDNLEFARRNRPGHVIGWTENPQRTASNSAFQEQGSTYVRQLTVPFYVPRGVDTLRWSLYGYVAAGTGSVQLTTNIDDAAGTATQTVALSTTWATPYTGALYRYDDVGQSTLGLAPESWCELRVDLKGDATNKAYIMGLCCWFDQAGA